MPYFVCKICWNWDKNYPSIVSSDSILAVGAENPGENEGPGRGLQNEKMIQQTQQTF